MMKRMQVVVLLVVIALITASAQAALLVEPHSSGLLSGNFVYTDGTTPSWSDPGGAYGLTATNTAFGGNGTIDVYTFSYTPGTDADNLVIPAGTDLGNGDLASGLVGGGSGLYNVYTTWLSTDNANAGGIDLTITHAGGSVFLDDVDQNGYLTNPGGNKWLLIAEAVQLNAGTTYTVTQDANVVSYVSMRSAGVMWEAVPEPATMALLGLGGLFLRRRRR